MKRALRQLSRLLRLPALALLLFAVVANPVLAAVGDIHESALAVADHADPEHCDVSDDATSAVVDQDAGDVRRLGAEVDASNQIGLVLALGKRRRCRL